MHGINCGDDTETEGTVFPIIASHVPTTIEFKFNYQVFLSRIEMKNGSPNSADEVVIWLPDAKSAGETNKTFREVKTFVSAVGADINSRVYPYATDVVRLEFTTYHGNYINVSDITFFGHPMWAIMTHPENPNGHLQLSKYALQTCPVFQVSQGVGHEIDIVAQWAETMPQCHCATVDHIVGQANQYRIQRRSIAAIGKIKKPVDHEGGGPARAPPPLAGAGQSAEILASSGYIGDNITEGNYTGPVVTSLVETNSTVDPLGPTYEEMVEADQERRHEYYQNLVQDRRKKRDYYGFRDSNEVPVVSVPAALWAIQCLAWEIKHEVRTLCKQNYEVLCARLANIYGARVSCTTGETSPCLRVDKHEGEIVLPPFPTAGAGRPLEQPR